MIVRFRSQFAKDLDKISDKLVLSEIKSIIEASEKASKPNEIRNFKKMKGDKTAFRIRVGSYRIGIYMINNELEFTRILPRDKIYKFFPR